MNTDAFMNLLTVVLVAGGVLIFSERWLRKYLEAGPSRIHHPFRIGAYFREAWVVMGRVKKIGWLLSGLLTVTYLSSYIIFYLYFGEELFESREATKNFMAENFASLPQLLLSSIKNLPMALPNTASQVYAAFDAAGLLFFVIFMTYLAWKWKKEEGPLHKDKVIKIFWYLFASSIILVIVSVVEIAGIHYTDVGSGSNALNIIESILKNLACLFSGSVAEGIFLVIVFSALRRKSISASDALNGSYGALASLFIYNLLFFSFPFLFSSVLIVFNSTWSNGHFISDYVVMTIRTLFILSPFILVMDDLPLSKALKNNLKAILRAPVDYFVLIVSIYVTALIVSLALGVFTNFVMLPFSFELYLFGAVLLRDIVFIWFSLFAACVIAVFTRQKFLYEKTGPSVRNEGYN